MSGNSEFSYIKEEKNNSSSVDTKMACLKNLKSVLLVAVLVVLVSCDENANEDDGKNSSRIVRQVEAEIHPAVQEQNMDVTQVKDQVLLRRLKGQEGDAEIVNDGNNDGIEKINRFKRSPKALKKGGGVAKGGGGCKKGRK